jgi:hypothetical protein
VRNGCQLHEIDHGHGIVGSADVSIEAEARPQKRRPMLSREKENRAEQQQRTEQDDADFGSALHVNMGQSDDG